jgi:hypothetical protein
MIIILMFNKYSLTFVQMINSQDFARIDRCSDL